jgi:transcriptional regulator of acetoin/glycerol metabolism
MPLELQARLLRVLDERQVTPLGTEDTFSVDFQLISASHQHLPGLVREGRFREDLYYRLAGIELQLPPLRERSDRRELIREMLRAEGGADAGLTPEAERVLMEHAWPGNIRQLRHVLRTAAALSDGQAITREHLPTLQTSLAPSRGPACGVAGSSAAEIAATLASGIAGASGSGLLADNEALPVKLNPIQANERQVLLQLLEQHRWNVSNVAKALDVSRNTLYRKLHKLHIEVSHPE